MAIARAKLPEA